MNSKKKLSKDEYVTRKTLDEAVDAILQGVQLIAEDIKKDLNKKIDNNHLDLSRQIQDINHDTPTMGEFNKLEKRVSKLEINFQT